jgi:TonB-dependent receptor
MRTAETQRELIAKSRTPRNTQLARSIALALGVASVPMTYAQTAAAPAADTLEEVIVTGIRHSIETSIAAKRNSDSITENITAEDLGKLPDASIAESLARLPGLTGQRSADGRVNVISIRGLSPKFSGVLLNGREIVSSNDGRAVEYDQFPSELIGAATVYKTPNATLIGQGLSGTVNLMSRRPLDTHGREMALNVRGEANSNGTQVPGVASPIGKRLSFSYVNQFADNTVGLAVGYAHLDSTTQLRVTELDQYGDYTPYGLPLSGNAPTLYQPACAIAWGCVGQSMLPMFWTGSQSTKKNVRDGLMAVLEYQPNADLHSELDLYYSKFDTHEVGGKLTVNQFAQWGGAADTLSNVGTTQVGHNTYSTSATASELPTTTTNYETKRKDRISALGWNTSLKVADKWTAMSDLSFSRDVRDEKYEEVYAGPWSNATNNWAFGPFKWNVPVSGTGESFTPLQPGYLSDPSGIKFGDETGFNYVPGDPQWTGVIRDPHVEDEIKTLRLSAKRPLDGLFSAFNIGVNYTQRDKIVSKNETRLIIPLDPNSTTICASSLTTAGPCNRDIPAAAVRAPLDMSWMGVPSFIRLDVPYLVDSGALGQRVAELELKTNDSTVHEKVTTAFAMLDIDTHVAGIPIRGNVGLQAVHTKQNSEGWEYRGNNDNVDFNLLYKRTGGTSYDDVLPSLNLVAELKNNLIVRFGLGTTMARPEINDLRAGTSTPTLDINPGPNQGYWSTAYAGNPNLRPWKSHDTDISIEKYFGKRSYVSAAAFHKSLVSYIAYGTSARDNSAIPLPPNLVLDPGKVVQQYGPVFQPLNGSGGRVEGFELAASLEGALLTKMLDGFGVVISATKINSSIRDQKVDQNSNQVIAGSATSIDGLSGRSNNVTVYYEKHGFSARVSQRYRSAFTATTRDIFFRPTTRSQGSDKVADMQLGYAFDDAGAYKGLSVLLQVNNLTDTYTRNYKTPGNLDVPDPSQLVPNYTYQFGRQTLLGVNYKF